MAATKKARRQLLVKVAKDAIKQLQAKKYLATHEGYCVLPYVETGSLQKQLPDIKTCNVCAKGAIFASLVKFKNDFDVTAWNIIKMKSSDNFIKTEPLHEKLSVFDKDNLNLIELAYEGSKRGVCAFVTFDEDSEKAAVRFYKTYRDSEKRMIAIMENIIANEGVFKP